MSRKGLFVIPGAQAVLGRPQCHILLKLDDHNYV
jgi:hypothetical protein